jgi:hypothetical protein
MTVAGTRTEATSMGPVERTTGYVVLAIALTFLCNVFLGEETRAFGFAVPFIVREFCANPGQVGFIKKPLDDIVAEADRP